MPIGHGQTISQPYIVALSIQSLGLTGNESLLEIGTGSGYQTALLAQLVTRVLTLERVPELAADARRRLAALGFRNVRVEAATEELGCPQFAPYDAIVVSAAAPRVPETLLDQLAKGGRMVLPVGTREEQELLVVEKTGRKPKVKSLARVRFVPLIGEGAWPS